MKATLRKLLAIVLTIGLMTVASAAYGATPEPTAAPEPEQTEETENTELIEETENTEPAVEVVVAELAVDGEGDEVFSELKIIEADGELYLNALDIFNILSTADMPLSAWYNAETNQVELSTKPAFEDGVALRDVLTDAGFKIDEITHPEEEGVEEMTVPVSKGNVKAVLRLKNASTEPVGILEYENKTAEFDFYSSGGSTYIIKESFLNAMSDVGL